MKKQYAQNSPYDSPWSLWQRIKIMVWEYVWLLFCVWTPKPANLWRLSWLRLFGCTIYGKPFVHDRSCLGDRANAYTLGIVEIFENATVGQEVYLCTGTHAFNNPEMNLITSKITVHKGVFIGARAFIMPGITIGENAIVGAGSVVIKNIDRDTVVAGNPAKFIKSRKGE